MIRLSERPSAPLIVRGRYQIVPEGEDKPKPHTRVTNFARKLEDGYTLTAWKQRNVLLGAAQRPDIIAATLAAGEDKRELDRLAEVAMEAAKANVARETGTALHTLTEQVDAGMDVTISSPWREDIDAYTACLQSLGAKITRMEEVVVLPELGLAGRFDRLVDIMGTTYVMDLKTGADLSYSWLSIAIQLASYAQASTIYHPDAGETERHEPMPQVDHRKALVVHLPAGQATATPYWVDLGLGRRGIELTKTVLDWRAIKVVAVPAINQGIKLREYVVARVQAIVDAGHGSMLAQRWPIDVPTLREFDQHSESMFDAILAACTTVEGLTAMPFPAVSDPRVRDQMKTTSKGKR
jgi:hypothetical protein